MSTTSDAFQPTKECSQPKMMQYGARSIFMVPLVHALRLSENKKNKKMMKHGKCRGRYLRVGVRWEVRLVMCTVQSLLPCGKLCLPVYGPIQE